MADVQGQAVARTRRPGGALARVAGVLWQEVRELHLRLCLVQALLAPVPANVGSRVRAYALRLAGFAIGRGTLMWGMPTITGEGDIYRRLRVGRECHFNIGCYLEAGDVLEIGDRVSFGPQAMVLTTSHEVGPLSRRAGDVTRRAVHIGSGAWIGARAVILPGVTIGAGAVVAAGAVVNRDVPPNTVVAGVPARVVKAMPE